MKKLNLLIEKIKDNKSNEKEKLISLPPKPKSILKQYNKLNFKPKFKYPKN